MLKPLQAQEAAFETEQYKEENRELQNQLRLMSEEQETLTLQLEQTGHVLDEANAEIHEKESESGRLQALLTGREHEIEDLKTQREPSLPLPPLCVFLPLRLCLLQYSTPLSLSFFPSSVAEADVVKEKLRTLELELEQAQ